MCWRCWSDWVLVYTNRKCGHSAASASLPCSATDSNYVSITSSLLYRFYLLFSTPPAAVYTLFRRLHSSNTHAICRSIIYVYATRTLGCSFVRSMDGWRNCISTMRSPCVDLHVKRREISHAALVFVEFKVSCFMYVVEIEYILLNYMVISMRFASV